MSDFNSTGKKAVTVEKENNYKDTAKNGVKDIVEKDNGKENNKQTKLLANNQLINMMKNNDLAKFKIPKQQALSKLNLTLNKIAKQTASMNTSENSNISDFSAQATNQTTANQSISKPLLKDELAIEPTSTLTTKGKSTVNRSYNEKQDGYSLTVSPLPQYQNITQKQILASLNVTQQNNAHSTIPEGQLSSFNPSTNTNNNIVSPADQKNNNKKRINLNKKTTLVQELENMQNQANEQVGKQMNEQNFDLGLVPIDIYTTNDFETAEQIVEARGYVLQERIGSGAFAQVYKAWHVTEQVYTACKIIELKKKKKKRLNDLKHELYVLDKMDHPNIIKMYEHFLVDEKVYIFLEYASCGTLSDYVRKRGPLKESRSRKWFKQICSGLYHMHSHGISHRDIKKFSF